MAAGLQHVESYVGAGFSARGARGRRAAGPAARAEVSSGLALTDSLGGLWQATAARVLIAIEDRHGVYREAVGRFLQVARPRLKGRVASPRGLNGELRRLGPQIVVLHAGPPVPMPDPLPCWVEPSLDPSLAVVL